MADEPRRQSRSTVLLEEIQSEVRKVAEGHGTLVRGQHELRTEIAQLNLRIGQVEQAVIQGFKDVRASISWADSAFWYPCITLRGGPLKEHFHCLTNRC